MTEAIEALLVLMLVIEERMRLEEKTHVAFVAVEETFDSAYPL